MNMKLLSGCNSGSKRQGKIEAQGSEGVMLCSLGTPASSGGTQCTKRPGSSAAPVLCEEMTGSGWNLLMPPTSVSGRKKR